MDIGLCRVRSSILVIGNKTSIIDVKNLSGVFKESFLKASTKCCPP